jgi:hypothetical protein
LYKKKLTKANGYKKRAHTHTKGHGPKTPAGWGSFLLFIKIIWPYSNALRLQ